MKTYPKAVLDMLESGIIRRAHLLSFELDTPFYFTDVGFDIEHQGKNYRSSGEFIGLDSLSRHAEMRVGEVTFSFAMSNAAITATILGTDVYKRRVSIHRAYLSENNDILHLESVWRGSVTGRSDNDKDATIQLKAASRWAEFERANAWRTTPKSHHRRYPDDDAFKHAAKAAETIYWAGKAGAG